MKQRAWGVGFVIAACLAGRFGALSVRGDTFDWIAPNGTQNWADAANWVRVAGSGSHLWPSVAGDVAIVTNGASAGTYGTSLTVSLGGQSVTVGSLLFRANFTLNTGGAGGKLVLDNAGAEAVLIQGNELGSGNKTFNAPIEVLGRARVGSRHYSDMIFAGGFIGAADSVVKVDLLPNNDGHVFLRNNESFFGAFEVANTSGAPRGTVLDRDSSLGSASKLTVLGGGRLIVRYAIPDALMRRIAFLDGSAWHLDAAAGSTTNVAAPAQYFPDRGEFRFSGAAGVKWGATETFGLKSTSVRVQDSQTVGTLALSGAAGITTDSGKTLSVGGLALERGGTVFLGSDVVSIPVGAAGDSLDAAVPPALRWSLDNGVVWVSPRLGYHNTPVKLTGASAPWTLARFDAADFTDFATAGANDLALLATNATISGDATYAGLSMNGNTSLNVAGTPTPTVTLRNGWMGGSWAGNVYANLVFGESAANRRDGVIFSQYGGGAAQRFRARITADDLYVVGSRNGWSGQHFHDTVTFDLAGDLFANIDGGCSMNIDRAKGLDGTILTINSTANGRFRPNNITIGGLRGCGYVASLGYLSGTTLTLSNVVDSVFGGTVEDDKASNALKVRKVGGATQALGGVVTATGGIDVHEGTLRIDGAVTSSPLVFAGAAGDFAGGVLAGTGSVGTNVVVAAGGTLSPGGSVGTLTVAGRLAVLGGALRVELAGVASHDRVAVTGDAVVDGMAVEVVTLDGYAPTGSTSFPVLAATGSLSASGVTVSPGYTISVEGQSLVLRAIASGSVILVR